MRALTLVGDRKIDLVDLAAPPAPGPGDVQVRVRALSLNHPDLWGYHGVAFFKRLVAGAAGEATGDDVTSLLPGDRVVMDGALTCVTRKACRDGCDNVGGMGFHVDGFAPDVITMPGRRLVIKAPAGIAMRAPVTTVGDDPTADKERALDAEHAINNRIGRIEQMVRKIAGNKITGNQITKKRGIDVVFEHTGADMLPSSLLPLKRRRWLAASGPTVTFNLMQPFEQLYRIIGLFGTSIANTCTLLNKLAGRLMPVIDTEVAIAGFGQRLARIETRQASGTAMMNF